MTSSVLFKKLRIFMPVLLALFLVLSGCGSKNEENTQYYTSLSELEHKRIGALTGSIEAIHVRARLPEAELVLYDSTSDIREALFTGKIDAYADTDVIAWTMAAENPEIIPLDEPISNVMEGGSVFPKTAGGKALCDKYSDYIREQKANGTYDEILSTWMGTNTAKKQLQNLSTLEASNGTLLVAVEPTSVPFSYIQDGKLVGIDVDFLIRFAREKGYGLEFKQMNFNSILPAISTGKCDLACGGIAYTEERAESVYFGEPTYEGTSVVVVLRNPADGANSEDSVDIFTSIKESFIKNFIREDRWKLLLSGLLVTLELSALSGLFGTILGALVCYLRMCNKSITNVIADTYIRIFRGTPIVVLLLVLNYLIFTSKNFPAFWVCVIGFSLDFSAYTSEIFRKGIDAVPEGQAKAATAIGFGPAHGFMKVILPQALINILPVYTGQFIALVKLTSVAGYISLMDLTRASDIIRSRTYEAFSPLILTAIIYFLLSVILIALLGKLEKLVQPKTRNIKKIQKLLDDRAAGRLKAPSFGLPVSNEEDKPVLYHISHLEKNFGTSTPIKDISCDIRKGDVISIIGPSGTGKSTFLNMLNHLIPATNGEILFEGESILASGYDLNKLRRKVGMVFQSFYLFSHLTIVENIMLAQVELLHRSTEDAFMYSMEMLEKVGLAEKALRYPDMLSGGQQQRIAIARQLAMDPEMILFDEPTSALDPTTIGEVLSVIRKLAQSGMTMMIVTHEMKFAKDVANRVFYLDQGVICEEGTPEQIFLNPQKDSTRRFIGHLKALTIIVNGTSFDYPGALTQIETFGHKHVLDNSIIHKMITVIEELGVSILMEHFHGETDAQFDFEYLEAEGKMHLKATYTGSDFDALTQGDPISTSLIKNAMPGVSCTFAENTGIIEGDLSFNSRN